MLARQRKRLNIAGAYWSSWITKDRPATYSFHYAGLRRLNRDNTVTAKPAYRAFVKVIRQDRRRLTATGSLMPLKRLCPAV